VLDALKDAGLEDNTIVIFTSDHGEMGGSHHILLKTQPYEEALMVPFIVAGPGIPSGATDDKHFISGLDILPTVCDFAGIEAPKESLGMSVRKILASPSAPWRDAVYASVGTGVMMRLVRTQQYKYILLNRPNDREVLFDLASDPGETKNVVNDAALKDVLVRHRKLLTDWMAKTNDPFPRF
jgi:arylsulfatase A-like enzyme